MNRLWPDNRRPTDSRCMGCGYDLRGSIGAPCCPECGERLDLIRPLWTPERRYWVGVQVAAVSLLVITNVLTLGLASLGSPSQHQIAAIYFVLWAMAAAGSVVSLIRQDSLRQVPPAMVVTSFLALAISVFALALNAVAWVSTLRGL